MPHPSTPLARPIILGTKGKDVLAVKRALSRAGYIDWTSFTDVAGEFFIKSIHKFQHDVGLNNAGYGEKTHAALLAHRKHGSRTEWAWDSLSLNYEHEVYTQVHTSPETRIRMAIAQACRNIYAHRMSMAYSQARPFQKYSMGGAIPTRLDCSGLVFDCYEAGGARNPGNRNWDGEGYTGTLLNGGTQTTRDKLKLMDAVMYGFTEHATPAFPYGSPTHVGLYAGDGTVYSNGHYPMGHYNLYYGLPINCYVTYDVTP